MGKLIFLGDVYLKDDTYKISMEHDFIYNFEYVSEGDNYRPITNKINLLGTANFDGFDRKPLAVNLANNHILDFTERGFEQTIRLLKENDIRFFGAGKSEDNYNNPCFIKKDNKKIALIGYSDIVPVLCHETTIYNVANVDENRIKKDIEICKTNKVDYIVANVHWGREERPLNTKRQEKIGHMLIEAGVDLVIGHHPHCIQPYETYKGKYIFYSLGNFFFDDIEMPSYFDASGNAEFTMYKKHLNYGKKSLAVVCDLSDKRYNKIDVLFTKKVHRSVSFFESKNRKVIPWIYHFKLINEIVGLLRMFVLFFRSNILNGKVLINMKAIKKEIEFIKVKFFKN